MTPTPMTWPRPDGISDWLAGRDERGKLRTPAKGHPSGQIPSQCNRTNLTSAGNRQGLETTPWDTTQNPGYEDMVFICRRKVDRRPGSNESKTYNRRPSIAKLLTYKSVNDQADDLSALSVVAGPTLPSCGNLVGTIGERVTELTLKRLHSVEGVEKTKICGLVNFEFKNVTYMCVSQRGR